MQRHGAAATSRRRHLSPRRSRPRGALRAADREHQSSTPPATPRPTRRLRVASAARLAQVLDPPASGAATGEPWRSSRPRTPATAPPHRSARPARSRRSRSRRPRHAQAAQVSIAKADADPDATAAYTPVTAPAAEEQPAAEDQPAQATDPDATTAFTPAGHPAPAGQDDPDATTAFTAPAAGQPDPARHRRSARHRRRRRRHPAHPGDPAEVLSTAKHAELWASAQNAAGAHSRKENSHIGCAGGSARRRPTLQSVTSVSEVPRATPCAGRCAARADGARPRRDRGRRAARRARTGPRRACSPSRARSATRVSPTPAGPGVITYSRKVFIPLTRLCRDRCHYCTFATVPHRLPAALPRARRGARDRPRGRRAGLQGGAVHARRPARGPLAGGPASGSTSAATTPRWTTCGPARSRCWRRPACCRTSTPACCRWAELQRLKPVAPSMGMMLETTATRLWSEPGGPHYGSPDKEPAVRLRVLEDAGRVGVPFTTGILIGIGETLAERADVALRDPPGRPASTATSRRSSSRTSAPSRTRRCAACPTRSCRSWPRRSRWPGSCWARGPASRPRRTSSTTSTTCCCGAGIDDWGGVSPVTPDHVNPERPWPQIEELAEQTAAAGFTLRERLTIYPEYVRRGDPWLDPRLAAHVAALADPATGPGRRGRACPVGLPWQEPDGGVGASGRTDLHATIDTDGPHRRPPRRLRRRLRRLGRRSPRTASPDGADGRPGRRRRAPGCGLAGDDPAALLRPRHEAAALALFDARRRGPGRAVPHRRRPAPRRGRRRHHVRGQPEHQLHQRLLRRLPVLRVRPARARRRRVPAVLEQVADRAEEAWQAGATEVCMQGGIDPKLPVDRVRRAGPRGQGAGARACTCTRSRPMEIVTAAAKAGVPIRDWLIELREAGPGHHPRHRRGDPRRRGALGADQGQAADRRPGSRW